MKFFAVIILLAGFSVATYAQTPTPVVLGITGHADVQALITITSGVPLEFGNVTPGNVKAIGTANNILHGQAGGLTETSGSWTVGKGANTQVTLAFTLPDNLVNGSYQLPITFSDYSTTKLGKIGTKDVSLGSTLTPSFVINSVDYNSEYQSSSILVKVGGTVSPIALQASGSYSAAITLSATYN